MFALLHLSMLGWLAAAAAPIVIHLWSRRQRRETDWAAMQFLLAAIRKRRRRLFLEQWLLLAVRTLLIVLAVLAVFLSYQEYNAFSTSGDRQTHRLLVLDASYSMTYRAGERSRFDEARRIATQIVEQAAPGDAFTLLLLAGPPRIVVGSPAFKHREVLEELAHLAPTHSVADLPGTLAAAERVIEKAGSEQPRLTRHEVIFLTDLGRSGWAPPRTSAAAAEIRRRAEALAQSARLVILDVGQPQAENAAVVGLACTEPLPLAGRPLRFAVRLRNFGRSDLVRRSVELWADGRRVSQQTVDLPAGAEQTLGLSYSFDLPGDHALEARLATDHLELDDHRYLALRVRQAVRVLCVDGRSAAAGQGGASRFLRLALAPLGDEGAAAPVQTEVVAESGLLEREIAAFDVVCLCNVAQFTPSEARVLARCLDRGGNLIFFLGDRVQPERYNRQLAANATERILPARLGELIERPQQRLDPLGYDHPLVRVFRDRDKAGLLTTPVGKHYRLDPLPQSKARTALALPDGDPLIVEESLRRGRVILVATSADTSWTDLPRWPSFVPLVQEMLGYCLSHEARQRNYLVGQVLEGEAPGGSLSEGLSIVLPDGRSEPLVVDTRGPQNTWSLAGAASAGIYTLRGGKNGAQSSLYAVNLDTAESDLAALSLEQLRDDVWAGVPLVHQATWQMADDDAGPRASAPHPLPVAVLYGALGLLLVDVFLAWRAGARR